MESRKKIIPIIIVVVLFLVGVAFGAKQLSASAQKKKPVTNLDKRVTVKVIKAKSVAIASKLNYDASLEPVAEGTLSGKAAGKVINVLFDDGKYVTKGQTLIILDDQDIRNQIKQSQASLIKIKANIESTQREYNRARLLFNQGGTTKSDLDAKESALKVAKADLVTTQVSIETLRDNLGNMVIRAPISGVIDEKNVDLGQFVSPGAVLAKIKNISSVYAVIDIEQKDLNKIKIGQKATLKLIENNSTFQGAVSNINVTANQSARVFKCKIQIPNPKKLLRPGIFGKVEIELGQKQDVIVLPVNALTGSEDSYAVFVAEKGTAQKQTVSVGDISNGEVEITSGLKKGDNVIYTNLNILQDGDAVSTLSGQGE